jgi:hypothetical protein
MKKIIIGITLVINLVSISAFASGGKDVNPRVMRSFKSEFFNAENVNWSEMDGIYAANFTQFGSRIEAYFYETGELIGSIRNVVFNQLPLAVVNNINKKYNSAPIYELFEYNFGGETYYSMTLELPKKSLRIRCSSGGNVIVERIIKK